MSNPTPTKALHIALWGVQVTLALAFGAIGTTKLTTSEAEVIQQSGELVEKYGVGLIRFIGISEVLGAPLMAPQALVDKYKRKAGGKQKNPVYAAMVENLDQNVGKVLAELDRLKLTEKTLVIFTSDNGGLMGNPTNPITNNEPLRSQKGYPYEGGIRVPTVVKWPGKVAAGKQSDLPIVTLDWAPTILDYLGLNSQEQGLDGQSLVGVLAGGSLESRDLFWHFPH